MQFADPGDFDKNAEVNVYAYSKGINYLDTALGYCGDKSEKIFSAVIKRAVKISYDSGYLSWDEQSGRPIHPMKGIICELS